MRNGFFVVFLAALLFGGWYWFWEFEGVCPAPLTYRIGTIDSGFSITETEVKNALETAESLWESRVRRDLFSYASDGKVSVNFKYDERQERADEAESLLSELERKGSIIESVKAEYDRLTREYAKLKAGLDTRTAAYDAKLTAYNTEVGEWNARGGAPKDIYNRLEVTKQELAEESAELDRLITQFNALVRDIRVLAARGNSLTDAYNDTVDDYNSRLGEGGEFTQGDYAAKSITVYEFTSRDELELVLAHELGHALSLEHVNGETSIMYRAMGKQSKTTGVTQEDIAELIRVCGTGESLFSRLFK